MMITQRQSKINRQLQKDLAEIFQKEAKGLFQGVLITVTKVQITPDLSLARVYLSIFGRDMKEVLETVEKHATELRYQLGLRVKNQLRIVPELRFYGDDSLDYLENIERLLKE